MIQFDEHIVFVENRFVPGAWQYFICDSFGSVFTFFGKQQK